MSSSDKDTKTVRVLIFNGKYKAFQTWWVQFRAYGKMSRFIKALEEIPETDLLSIQNEVKNLTEIDDTTKKKKVAANHNDLAMASLTLTFKIDKLIIMILSLQSVNQLEGLASDVIKQLKKKYKPKDIISLVNEKVELNKIRMKSTDNLKLLFD